LDDEASGNLSTFNGRPSIFNSLVKRLVLGTNNSHKVFEVQSALAGLKEWEVLPQPEGIPEIEETGGTFLECAIQKASHVSRYIVDLVLADDSGLCIDALDGRPGVFSKRYAATDAARIDRVLREMESVADANRSARFVCALALAQRGSILWTTEGKVEGTIARTPHGTNGFGYDPIFRIPEFQRTMAELTIDEKNRISHRGRALQALATHFLSDGM
jgi:XTP/dITP diphosphohydrolase